MGCTNKVNRVAEKKHKTGVKHKKKTAAKKAAAKKPKKK